MSKERPIIFNSDMVRAILDGRKTQTRRPVKFPKNNCKFPFHSVENTTFKDKQVWTFHTGEEFLPIKSAFGQPGDRLWVRETFKVTRFSGAPAITYKADNALILEKIPFSDSSLFINFADKWKPSIHMPRWASRITLEITHVRVERVMDISEEDIKAEGINDNQHIIDKVPSLKDSFHFLWDSIYQDGWKRNDWVWVIEFKALTNKKG